MSLKMILFDIDGTLLLSGGVGMRAFEKAFEELYGVTDSWGEVIPDGKTDRIIFNEVMKRCMNRPFEDDEYAVLCDKYIHYFRSEIKRAERFRLMPGIPSLLDVLARRKDLVLGIATGNIEDVALLKLERGKLHHFFKFGGYGSDSHDRLELTQKSIERGFEMLGYDIPFDSLMIVGDSYHDIRVGHALGVRTIAVATGRAKADELAQLKPFQVFEDLTDIERFLNVIEE